MKPRSFVSLFVLISLTQVGCPLVNVLTHPAPVIDNEVALVENVRVAYQKRDYDKLQTLFARDSSQRAEYHFILGHESPARDTKWDLAAELCLHRRMFQSDTLETGQPPLPKELQLQYITIDLRSQGRFVERTDFYNVSGDSTGLDPQRWRVSSAAYDVDALFKTTGQVAYAVAGTEVFVVVEDRAKQAAEPGRFLLLQWEERGSINQTAAASSIRRWGELKLLYRCQ